MKTRSTNGKMLSSFGGKVTKKLFSISVQLYFVTFLQEYV